MGELSTKLWCRKTGATSAQACTLYDNTSDCEAPYLSLLVGGIKAYAKLGDVTDENASAIRVRRKSDNKVYAVLTTAITVINYYMTVSGEKIKISPSVAKEITENELKGKGTVTEVYFESTTYLRGSAFEDYTRLNSVYLPNCEMMGTGDNFRGCSSLKSVSLPSCISVPQYAFYGCSSLNKIELSACTSVLQYAFYGCSSLSSIELPACTEVSNNAFTNCTSLKSVSLPSLKWLRGNAFIGCSNLSSISAPNCVSVYGQFRGCSSLTTLWLPSVTFVDYNAFANSSLKEVHFAKKYQSKIESLNGYKATGSPAYYVGKFGKPDLKIYFDL